MIEISLDLAHHDYLLDLMDELWIGAYLSKIDGDRGIVDLRYDSAG